MLPVAGRFARSRAAAGALVVLAAAAACQPVDSEVPPPADLPAAGQADDDPAVQDPALPQDVPALLDRLDSVAAEWQAGTVVAEVAVRLDGDRWREATVTYLAPDADRLLLVQLDGEGTSQRRPTLETLDLEPVAAGALAQVPPLPDGVLDPGRLLEAAGEALGGCATGEVALVLYSTGAFASWDGRAWTEPPAWTATISGEAGDLVVDPVTAEAHPAGCLDAG